MAPFNISLGDYCITVCPVSDIGGNFYGWSTMRHFNMHYELHIVLRGKCSVDVEAETYFLSEGDAILISSGQFHCPHEVSEDFLRLNFSFTIDKSERSRNFSQYIYPCVKLHFTDFELSLCKKIIEESTKNEIFGQEYINYLYSLLVCNMFRMLSYFIESTKAENQIERDDRFFIIDQFFEQNFREFGSEEKLAKMLNLSKRQLCRVLTSNYGMSFRSMLRHAKIDRAGWLLRTTDMPIAEIIEAIGYESEASFYKAFKAYYDMTPSKYRNKMKK